MALSSSNLNEIGDLYENIVSSDTEQLDEYAAGGTGPTAATLQKQRQAQKTKSKPSSSTPPGVTAKVGPVTIGVTNPKTDIGKRSADFLSGLGRSAEKAINRLGNYSAKPSTAPAKPSAAPARPATAAPATRPTAAAPATRPTARPATASAPARPASAAQGGGMATWAAKYPQLAAKVTSAGTQRGTGQSTMAKQAVELRGMQKASQERQAAQSGPTYSSSDVKSKMSSRTKTMLGLKDSYDIVLDYLVSQGHVDTLEEALYVMIEMDTENIRSIVEGVMPEPIDPAAHKAAQKTQKIYNLGKGTNNPNEAQSALKRTGPQLPGV